MIEETIIKPNKEWFIYNSESPLNFPSLHYKKLPSINIPINANLRQGGSYNYFQKEPFYLERCQILENCYMPYDIEDSKHFIIKEGDLDWPGINVYAYTDLNDPKSVYIKDKINDNFIAKLVFLPDRIELYEATLKI